MRPPGMEILEHFRVYVDSSAMALHVHRYLLSTIRLRPYILPGCSNKPTLRRESNRAGSRRVCVPLSCQPLRFPHAPWSLLNELARGKRKLSNGRAQLHSPSSECADRSFYWHCDWLCEPSAGCLKGSGRKGSDGSSGGCGESGNEES